MGTSLALPLFDDCSVSTPMDKLYNVVGDLLDVSTRKNPLYYANHFQYRHGSLFRAILGRQHVWDKNWEERLVKCLDKFYHHLMERGEYSLECYRSVLSWPLRIKGWLWVDEQPPYSLVYPAILDTVKIKPGTYIYARVDGDRVDIEGQQVHSRKEIIISVKRELWDQVKAGFEVVNGKSSTSRTHQKNHDAVPAVSEEFGAETD